MTRKELRIMEIMAGMNVDQDTAEQLFMDELETMFPNLPEGDFDTRETLYELN